MLAVHLVAAEPIEFPALWTMRRDVMRPIWRTISPDYEEQEECHEWFRSSVSFPGTSWIEYAGARVGTITITPHPQYVHVQHLVILEGFQGRGIGQIVMRDVLKEAHAARRDVRLSVHTTNVRTLSFYQRLGFQITGIEGDETLLTSSHL